MKIVEIVELRKVIAFDVFLSFSSLSKLSNSLILSVSIMFYAYILGYFFVKQTKCYSQILKVRQCRLKG